MTPPLDQNIIKRIILDTLPPLSFNSFSERYTLLRACCLVNSSWRRVAQTELRRHRKIVSYDYKGLELIKIGSTDSVWILKANHKDLEEDASWSAGLGPGEAFANVLDVWIGADTAGNFATVNIGDFHPSLDDTMLHLNLFATYFNHPSLCDFPRSSHFYYFWALRTLAFCDPFDARQMCRFIKNIKLPRLDTLTISRVGDLTNDLQLYLAQSIAGFAGQLAHLTLNLKSAEVIQILHLLKLDHFRKLETLALAVDNLLFWRFLKWVPKWKLRRLRILPTPDLDFHLWLFTWKAPPKPSWIDTKALKGNPSALVSFSQLELVILPDDGSSFVGELDVTRPLTLDEKIEVKKCFEEWGNISAARFQWMRAEDGASQLRRWENLVWWTRQWQD